MFVVPELKGVTESVTEEDPSVKVTWVFDREITDISKPVRFTVNPPAGAGLLNDRVNEPVTPGTFSRFNCTGARLIFLGAAVIVTVVGSLLANPSFTINCTTYVPATSAKNVGVRLKAAESVLVLPCGFVVNVQE